MTTADTLNLPDPPPGPPGSGGIWDDDAFEDMKAVARGEAATFSKDAGNARGVLLDRDAAAAERDAYKQAIHDFNRRLADYPCNDLGNAWRLDARFGWALMHVRDLGWFGWEGTHWQRQGGEERAVQCAYRVSDGIRAEAARLQAELDAATDLDKAARAAAAERIDKHRKFATASGNANRVRAMLDALAPHRTISPRLLDADPLRLALRDGTLRLNGLTDDPPPPDPRPPGAGVQGANNSTVVPYPVLMAYAWRREDLITRLVDTDWHALNIDNRGWRAFLARILPDAELRAFVQRWFGYCLTGLVSEQAMAVFIGQGANGKSTLLMVISRLLGAYATTLPIETLVGAGARSGGDVTPDLLRLPGARLVTVSEPEPGAKLNESLIKRATGGADMSARNFHKEFFDFTARFKLVLDTNNRPRIAGADDGIWRRLLIVPFTVQIPIEQRRRQDELVAELLSESPGILRWLADGYVAWRERGLAPPKAVLDETLAYRSAEDRLNGFLADCTERAEGERVRADVLYRAYRGYCQEAAVEPMKGQSFGRRLNEKGIPTIRSDGIRRDGLKLTAIGTALADKELVREQSGKKGMF